MKTRFFTKITAVKSFIAVICAVSLVATGITGCGTSQPDSVNTVSNEMGGRRQTGKCDSANTG